MHKLSQENLSKAEEFLRSQARPLEQALFATFIQGESTQWALGELAAFQNSDGGFGHGLEPDIQMPGSSVLATTIALQLLRDLEVSVDNPLVRGAMRFLVLTYDSDAQAWPLVPAEVIEAPRAPWWLYNPDLRQALANPRAEIVGYLFQFPDFFPTKESNLLLADVCRYLAENRHSLEMHEALCYVRLLETESLPAAEHDYLHTILDSLIRSKVETDPDSWDNYVLKPLQVARAPDSTFAPLLEDSLAKNLDFEIARQGADGSWAPNWSWGDSYLEAWLNAKRAWQGVLTVATCKSLFAYKRIAD
jgi:hypothetical protein